ncbi:aldolase [Kineococcus sp. R8]|uniref:aldolase n=1 Tax=Kineococcus siccus TaxID=2696567 RepID=UPI001411C589|nr:aldolase [Kineococcus siccus]NAZ81945.1 aldolase [Kineococcus siccus]
MTPRTADPQARLDALRTASGGFAMVALDQRESLREMFAPDDRGRPVGDAVLAAFKAEAAAVLTPAASGVLLDHPLGVPGPQWPRHVAPACGLVLAADDLHSVPGEGVVGSSLQQAVDVDLVRATGAAAVKLLVIWRRGTDAHRPLVAAFLDLARAAGVASLVEGIVRPAEGAGWASAADRHDAIVEAAADLSPGAAVYKAEVPGYVPGDVSGVRAQSRRVSDVVDGPWVVLSNGTRQEDFAAALGAACAGGAHGFLAGRAVWADVVREPDPSQALRERSLPRLHALRGIVDRARDAAGAVRGAAS